MPTTRADERKGLRRRGFRIFFYKSDASAVRQAAKAGFGTKQIEITDLGGASINRAVRTSADGYKEGCKVVIARMRRSRGQRFLRPWLWVMALKNQRNKENDDRLVPRSNEAAVMRAFFSYDPPVIPLLSLP
jgi:hypothetical protein